MLLCPTSAGADQQNAVLPANTQVGLRTLEYVVNYCPLVPGTALFWKHCAPSRSETLLCVISFLSAVRESMMYLGKCGGG